MLLGTAHADHVAYTGITYAHVTNPLRVATYAPLENRSYTFRDAPTNCLQCVGPTCFGFGVQNTVRTLWNPLVLGSMGKDCLQLNVYTPDEAEEGGRPVAVYIHGGGGQVGSLDSYLNPVQSLVGLDVVSVAINYRLGPYGYPVDADGRTLNVALDDQRLALRWVSEHAHRFGGRSDRVVVIGSSAGGTAVGYHAYHPVASAYFQRAIVMAAPVVFSNASSAIANPTIELCECVGADVTRCEPTREQLARCSTTMRYWSPDASQEPVVPYSRPPTHELLVGINEYETLAFAENVLRLGLGSRTGVEGTEEERAEIDRQPFLSPLQRLAVHLNNGAYVCPWQGLAFAGTYRYRNLAVDLVWPLMGTSHLSDVTNLFLPARPLWEVKSLPFRNRFASSRLRELFRAFIRDETLALPELTTIGLLREDELDCSFWTRERSLKALRLLRHGE